MNYLPTFRETEVSRSEVTFPTLHERRVGLPSAFKDRKGKVKEI